MAAERPVEAGISYFGDAPVKPTFHAQDHARDNWRPDPPDDGLPRRARLGDPAFAPA
ncbi:MAG: hypothetical protein WDN24_11530 [Sphingomonas sp.]